MKLTKQANETLNRLNTQGFQAYVVGGGVRDYLLRKEPKDLDIATNALPADIIRTFQDFRIIETGIKHGTLTVIIDDHPVEITTFRVDQGYSDHRHPDQVFFTSSLEQDLARRDFTMNAIAYNPEEGFFDFFQGVEDIHACLIRTVGNPEHRFEEDALRILRALRFSSQLNFEIEEKTKRSIFRKKDLLKNISMERITSEFIKTLLGQNVRAVLSEYIDIFAVFLPELLPMKSFQQNSPYHIYDVLEHSLIALENILPVPHLRLAALFHDIGKPETYSQDQKGVGHFYGHSKKSVLISEEVLDRMKLDKDTKERVCTLIRYHGTPIEPKEKFVKRWMNRLTPEVFFDLMELKSADHLGKNPQVLHRMEQIDQLKAIAKEVIQKGACFTLEDLALNGHDLMDLGFPEGKEIGEILSLLLSMVMEGKLKNQRKDLIDFVKGDMG